MREVYVLSVECVSGDEIQFAIHERKDVLSYLAQVDHEGSSWSVDRHLGDPIERTDDLTEEFTQEYRK